MNIQSATLAQKRDAGKLRLDLLPIGALEEVAKAIAFGAVKYSANEWRKGMHWHRLIGATLRHVFAFCRGEDRDEESGILHLAHAASCLLFLLTYQLDGIGVDDRIVEVSGDRSRTSLPDQFEDDGV